MANPNSNRDNPVSRLERNPPMQPPIAILERDRPWNRKCVLTLDGGGIRGYSALLILRALMEAIEKQELSQNPEARSSTYTPLVDCLIEDDFEPSTPSDIDDDLVKKKRSSYRPCHYFDYIGGSSTGGLIALMTGRLRMSVDEALISYQKLWDSMVGLSSIRMGMSRIGFKNAALVNNYESVIKALRPLFPSPNELGKEFQSDSARCKTIVCSIQSGQDKRHKKPFLFRSYNKSLEIWQVARATSAAPFYFEPVALGDDLYYDAAGFFYNPTRYVLDEVRREARGRQDAVDILSIGAGNLGDAKGNIWKPQRTDGSDPTHESLKLETKYNPWEYHRLDVQDHRNSCSNELMTKGSGRKTLRRVIYATTKYLQTPSVRDQIQEIAERLVSIRLRRAETMQWERFATGIIYQCPISECSMSSSRFEDRGDLMDHLQDMHDKSPPDVVNNREIQGLLNKGRTNSG